MIKKICFDGEGTTIAVYKVHEKILSQKRLEDNVHYLFKEKKNLLQGKKQQALESEAFYNHSTNNKTLTTYANFKLKKRKCHQHTDKKQITSECPII